MPGQPFTRSRAFTISPGDSPSRIASCHRRRRIVIQRVRKLLTYALKSLCGTISRAATENYLSPVNKLWTMRLSCGALRKTGEKSRRDITRSLCNSYLHLIGRAYALLFTSATTTAHSHSA
jgi:hypothetical protein